MNPGAPDSRIQGFFCKIWLQLSDWWYMEKSCKYATLASGFNLLILVSLLGCYGVPPAKASEDWMCSRCSANALEEVSASMVLLSSS